MYHKAFLAALLLLAAPSITSPVLEARGGGIMITPNGPVDTRAGNGRKLLFPRSNPRVKPRTKLIHRISCPCQPGFIIK